MKESPTRVQRFFRQWQEHHIVSIVLIVCISIIGVATFTDSIDKLLQFSKKYIFTSTPQSKRVKFDAPGSKPAEPIASESRPVDSKQPFQKTKPKRKPELSKEVSTKVEGKLTTTLKTEPIPPETRPFDSKHLLPKVQPAKGDPQPSKEVPPEVNGKLAATLKTVTSASDIREVVSTAASALLGETTNDRVRSVAALLSNLPRTLTQERSHC